MSIDGYWILLDPEDCDVCGCPSTHFRDKDYICGMWVCPECGVAQ